MTRKDAYKTLNILKTTRVEIVTALKLIAGKLTDIGGALFSGALIAKKQLMRHYLRYCRIT